MFRFREQSRVPGRLTTRARVSRALAGLVACFVIGLVTIGALDLLLPPPLDRLANVSRLVVDRNGQWVHGFTNEQGRWRFAADLAAIDPAFIRTLIAIEDKRFYQHHGVDALAVARAGLTSLKAGRVVSGASTITMQTARLLEPRPRNVGSKLIEMLRALQIERRLSKDEILSAYLSLAPYGGNIQGVRAASLIWFGKEPQYLTLGEQALLIALPQAPEARRPDRRAVAARTARQAILNKLVTQADIEQKLADEAMEAPLPSQQTPLPRNGWHLAYELATSDLVNVPTHGAPMDGIVHSTLDLTLQRQAETLLLAHLLEAKDDATGAVMIVDNRTRQVRALVGSSGLSVPGGWIDLSRAVRSPGSALKPFIYALAFEDGSLAPDTVIDDVPQSFGGYDPENFDRTFRGEVRIREALQHSLNVPAVSALEKIGVERFFSSLGGAGVTMQTRARADQSNGLALALGGAGITMRDMAVLYTGLANDGLVEPLVWRAKTHSNDKPTQSYQLVSAQAAATINDILRDGPSLEGRAPALLSSDAPTIAFKTGTSYGFRDAWSAGYTDDYTIIVWIGRADGAPRPGQTGRKAAAPLLFSIFDMVSREGEVMPVRDRDEPDLITQTRSRPALSFKPAPPPDILFPQDGVEMYVAMDRQDQPGIALAARGGRGQLNWFVNGAIIERDAFGGRAIWRPAAAGFYTVMVVDATGNSSAVSVRVSEIS